MTPRDFPHFSAPALRTPAYVIDVRVLEDNLRLLAHVQSAAGCKILLALKAFAAWSTFPLISRYLAGAAASSLFEAQLASEHLKGELHLCAPAYPEEDFIELVRMANHIVFNSLSQWLRFAPVLGSNSRGISCGLRINPEHSEASVSIYDPCSPLSRLGVRAQDLPAPLPRGIEGLHFHTLCQSGAPSLQRTIEAVERRFACHLRSVRWVNFGGGHLVTSPGYDVGLLIELIRRFRNRWNVDVYLEPGEAVALNAGYLVTTVLDIIPADLPTAILDTSATAHMPDVLEMPYRPAIVDAGEPGVSPFTYRLGGLTCLAGDVIGEYSFERPLTPGQKLVFLDMAQYTMVKNTLFNGVRLPSIVLYDGEFHVQRSFGYRDYRDRLS